MENKKWELIKYISVSVQKGVFQDEIKKQLRMVGWSEEEINQSYAEALIGIGVPIPDKNLEKSFTKKSSTVEIIINLFSFILLGIFATSLGVLSYGIINYFLPDRLAISYDYGSFASFALIHYAIAALVISFPLYYFTIKLWFKSFHVNENKEESKLTKWITYLVLLITAILIVGDLIAVIFNVLQGEITIRFFLKALVILLIVGGIFGFYFLERKKVQYRKEVAEKMFSIFGWLATGLIIVAIILGFVVSGSPTTGRKRSFDEIRANDLQELASCIGDYASKHKALPNSLVDLQSDSSYSYCANKKDPETGEIYEYKVIKEKIEQGQIVKGEFELCADFSLILKNQNYKQGFYNENNNSKWYQHEIGRSCDSENVVLYSLIK